MNKATTRAGLWAVLVAALALGGCAVPKVITRITSSGDQVKLGYSEAARQGIIQCRVGPNGELSQCHELKLEFPE